MSIDTGDERIDEQRRPRHQAVQRMPRAQPGQAKGRSDYSSSQETVGFGVPTEEKSVSRGPQGKAGPSQRAPLFSIRLGPLRYYGLALLFVGGAVLLCWALSDVLSPTPFLIFYLAWVGAAAFGGLGPGLLATLTSWLCIELLFDYTPGHIGFSDPTTITRLLVFLSGGLVVSVVGERIRRSRTRERRQTQELAAANAALHESEVGLAKAHAIARLGNWEVDAGTGGVRGSEELYRLFNLGPDAPLDAYIDKFHPEDRPRVIESINAAIHDEKHYSVDYRVLPSPDTVRYVHAEGEVACDDKGRPITFFGTVQDITEQKKAEEALRKSEEKYRFLVENSKDVTWVVDLQGRWTFISSNVEKVAGYRADEVLGKTIWDFLAPECHDLVREKLRRRARGEDLPPYEVLMVDKDGRRIPFELVATAVVDDGGNVVGVQGVSRDITERKRVEEALRESEFHLAQAQQIAHLGSWSWDIAENRLYWSDEIYRLYGLQPGESEPRHEDFLGFVHPEDRPRVQQGVQ